MSHSNSKRLLRCAHFRLCAIMDDYVSEALAGRRSTQKHSGSTRTAVENPRSRDLFLKRDFLRGLCHRGNLAGADPCRNRRRCLVHSRQLCDSVSRRRPDHFLPPNHLRIPGRWRGLHRSPQQLGGTAGADRRSGLDDRLCSHGRRQRGGRHRGPDLSRTEFVRASRSPRARRHHLHYRHESSRRAGVGEILRRPHLLCHRRPRSDGGGSEVSRPSSDKVSHCRRTTRRRSKT